MTQPPYPGQPPVPPPHPGQPPAGGPPGGPAPGPYGAPPPPAYGQPPQGPNPYGQPPQGPPPYGQQPYGQPQFGSQPPPPPPAGGGNKKTAAIVAAAVAAVLVVGGGIFLATSGDDGDDGDDKPRADKSAAAQASPKEEPSATAEPSDDASDLDLPSPSASGGVTGGGIGGDDKGEPPATGFKGQWQDERTKTLTIGDKQLTGQAAGKHIVSYLDPGGDGICTGLGKDQSGGGFRLALKCGSGANEKFVGADLRRSGDSVVMDWDKGGSDTLKWVGGLS
ncbi:hypothetical protein [Streptomyces sp. G45]|uniref:hypothetical protein n=1 Tax=Streptomyces sp. G45 TaxID=3406627 RepID=UPI003C289EEE